MSTMKFTTDRKKMLDQIKRISGLIQKNPVIPCLGELRLSITNNVMQITASNMECFATVDLPATQDDPEEYGVLFVEAAPFIKLLNEIPGALVNFETNFETLTLMLPTGRYTFSIPTQPEDYPTIPDPDQEDNWFFCYTSDFETMMGKVSYAAGTDQLRPAMTCVMQKIGPAGDAVFVATDANILAKAWDAEFCKSPDTIHLNTNIEETTTILWTPDAVKHLTKFLQPGPMRVWIGEKQIFVQQENDMFSFSMLDAKYVDYEAVIRTSHNQTLFIPTTNIRDVLDRMAVVANKIMLQAELTLEKRAKYVTLATSDMDFDRFGEERVNLDNDIVTRDLQIGVSIPRLTSILDHMATEPFVRFHFDGPGQAILMMPYPSNGAASADHTPTEVHLLMPIMLNPNRERPTPPDTVEKIKKDWKDFVDAQKAEGVTVSVTTSTHHE